MAIFLQAQIEGVHSSGRACTKLSTSLRSVPGIRLTTGSEPYFEPTGGPGTGPSAIGSLSSSASAIPKLSRLHMHVGRAFTSGENWTIRDWPNGMSWRQFWPLPLSWRSQTISLGPWNNRDNSPPSLCTQNYRKTLRWHSPKISGSESYR